MVLGSKTFSILILTSILFVAVFGFLGAGMTEHGGSHSCLFAFAGSEACAPLQSAIAITAHLLDMLERLSLALASFDIFALVFSFVFLLAILLFYDSHSRRITPQKFYQSFLFEPDTVWKNALLRWLAYHNKRDIPALARVHL